MRYEICEYSGHVTAGTGARCAVLHCTNSEHTQISTGIDGAGAPPPSSRSTLTGAGVLGGRSGLVATRARTCSTAHVRLYDIAFMKCTKQVEHMYGVRDTPRMKAVSKSRTERAAERPRLSLHRGTDTCRQG